MNAPTPLPDLFGRFTAILKEHDHLGKSLARLKKMCAALEGGIPIFDRELSPERLFEELHADLGGHFGAEESEEYFGVVLEEAPALASEIGRLVGEHADMLVAVERLRALARARERWSELPAPARTLISELERHERAESVLLRQLFSR